MHKLHLIYMMLFVQLAVAQKKILPTYCPGEPARAYKISQGDTIFSAAGIDIKPRFPGGIEAFYKQFAAEFKIPIEKPELKGRMFIKFVIEKDGSLSNIMVLRDLGYGTGAEAIRLIKKMPKWEPVQYKKKAVRCDYTLPINIPYEPLQPGALKITEIPDKQ